MTAPIAMEELESRGGCLSRLIATTKSLKSIKKGN